MKLLSTQKNSLQEKVSSDIYKKSCNWETVESADLSDFPTVTDEQLREITLGVYMIKLSKCYAQEHILDGQYELRVCKHTEGILSVKLQSRHTSNLKHKLWIEYDLTKITAWYCTCKAGARVVGSCAHVTSVIWYLGQRNRMDKTPVDWSQFITDAAEQ